MNFHTDLDYWLDSLNNVGVLGAMVMVAIYALVLPLMVAGMVAYFVVSAASEIYLGIRDGLPELRESIRREFGF